ncbi:hypothetical protein V2J09_001895 [Rumex salicifolius]
MEASNPRDKTLNKFALACAVVASIISIIFGYDTGVISGALIFIKEDLKITDVQEEILAGILNFCALIGSLLAGRISDYVGRRYTISLASIIFLLGSVLMGYGPNYAVLMLGRCTAGIGVGFALMIAPVYSAEISSASHRGVLTSLPELCISVGILLGYVSNYGFGKLQLRLGWRLMLGIAAVPSLVLALAVLRIPESPRWLVMMGRLRQARKVLSQVSNSEAEAESRFQEIKLAAGINPNLPDDTDTIKPPKSSAGGELSIWKDIFIRPTSAVRWVLLAAVGIHFFQHAVGIEAVILYGPRIFKKAGITDKNKLLLANVGIGLTKTTFILLSTFLLDRVGRRPLLLTSAAGAASALATLGAALTVAAADSSATWALAVSIVPTYAYVGVFSAGIAPLTWVYSSEIWPLRLRAIGAGIGVAVNRLMNAAVSMSFISIYHAITIGGAFFMFAGVAVVAFVFFYFFLPETKGKSLEEIELMFERSTTSKGVGEMELQQCNNIVK